jgi:hypothetical protein
MDLQVLGEQLAARKAEIESEGPSPGSRRSSGTGASRRAIELVGKGVRSAH